MRTRTMAKIAGYAFLALPVLLLVFDLIVLPGPRSWGAEKQWRDVPGTIIIDEVPPVPHSIIWQKKFGPVKFNHKMHTGFTKCETCHHTHRNTAYGLCDNCHTQVPELFRASATHMFMGCRYCHGKYSQAKPGMPGTRP